MPLIKNGKIEQNTWHYLEEGGVLQASHNIVGLEYWQENMDALAASSAPLGLLVKGDEKPENFVEDLSHFSLIAIEIPTFADGRGYSLAKILRHCYGFKKEIRAIGDILPDQAQYLSRVGFDALELPNNELAGLALEKLTEISVAYQ